MGTAHAAVSQAVAGVLGNALALPPPWAALLLGAGVLFLLHGGRRRLPLALPGGAILGLAVAASISSLKGASALQLEPAVVAAAAGGLACAAWPPLFPSLAVALPLAWLGKNAWGGDAPWVAATICSLAGIALGALLREWVAAAAAGGIGAAAILAGAAGLFAKKPFVAELLERPMALVALWVVLAVAGAAFHAGRAWRPPGPGRRPGDEIHPADPAGPREAADL